MGRALYKAGEKQVSGTGKEGRPTNNILGPSHQYSNVGMKESLPSQEPNGHV